jgi:hypothetical protein
MKTIIKLIMSSLLMITLITNAQNNAPSWIKDINALPDTISTLRPVKVLCDYNGNILVLSTFSNNNSTTPIYQINLKKFNINGNLLWTYTYSNSLPIANNMVLDNAGNCYIAGGLNAPSTFQGLLLKVNSSGNLMWLNIGTTSFGVGNFQDIIIKNNMLFLSSYSGIAKFDLAGNELWSNTYSVFGFNVDHLSRVVFSGFINNTSCVCRLNSNGSLDFIDSTHTAEKIGIDNDNNIFLLGSNFPTYYFTKLDSSGTFQWSYNQLPVAPAFGDFGMEVLADMNNDILLVGIQDTIFKLNPNGQLLWKKTMSGLDNYQISAKMDGSNLYVAGTVSGFGSGISKVAFFDLNGNESWSATYNGVVNGQEFLTDFDFDANGFYLLENLNQNGRLIKFDNPYFNNPANFNQVCVDSVWYDATNPNIINVRVFNGSLSFINYPSVQIVAPNGDTISNQHALVSFFGQIYNTYQTYTDTILVTGISDFSNYTFLMGQSFNDTTAIINFCNTTNSLILNSRTEVEIYPNPAVSEILISGMSSLSKNEVSIVDMQGREVITEKNVCENKKIDVSSLTKGIYMINVITDGGIFSQKMIKQ